VPPIERVKPLSEQFAPPIERLKPLVELVAPLVAIIELINNIFKK
jgi:hypothetical protein